MLYMRTAGATLLALCCWLISGAALGGTRVALVIGNSAYEHTRPLATPVRDATDIAAALRGLGYSVRLVTDVRKAGMEAALTKFSLEATGADQAVIYYAGLAVAVAGVNYLLPVDASIASEASVPREAVALATIMHGVSAARRLGLVVLDASRDNPLAAHMRHAGGSPGAARGLAPVKPAGNLLVASAERDGHVAAEGTGRISPYTGAILSALQVQGLEIRPFWKRVRERVMSATGSRQQPSVHGSPGANFIYLNPPSTSGRDAPAAVQADQLGAEPGRGHTRSTAAASGGRPSASSHEEGRKDRPGTPPEALLEEIRQICGKDVQASWFETSAIRLGDPQEPDLMIRTTDAYKGGCPSFGSAEPILAVRVVAQKYELILTASGLGDPDILDTRHNGYRDIRTRTTAQAAIYTLLYQYDGHKYQEVDRQTEKIE